jgi:TolB protein
MSNFNLPMYPFFMQPFMSWRRLFTGNVAAALLLCVVCGRAAAAPLAIEIIGGGANQIPITVLPFAGEERFAQRIGQIISADRQRAAPAGRAFRDQLPLLEK